MRRGGAAAAAHHGGPRLHQLGQLLGKVVRLALIHGAPSQHRRIPRVGHHRQRLVQRRQALGQCQQRPGAGHAVEAHRVHRLQRGGAQQQVFAVLAQPGGAGGIHRKAHQQKGVGAALFQPRRRLGHAVLAGQRFQQEIRHPLLQKQLHLHLPRFRGGAPGLQRRGAKVGKHRRVKGGGLRQRKAAGGLNVRGGSGGVAKGGVHPRRKGVGLDGPAARLQIRPVDGRNGLRVVDAGLLHPLVGMAVIGAHGAVKQQRTAPGQMFPNVHIPSSSFTGFVSLSYTFFLQKYSVFPCRYCKNALY